MGFEISLIWLNETVEVFSHLLMSWHWIADTVWFEWVVVIMDLGLSFASLENNSGLSIQGQALRLIPGRGRGQQLWLHQGPIRGCVSSARPAPAGVYVSAPLQETEGDGGRQEDRQRGKGWRVKLWLCKLRKHSRTVMYCNRAGKPLVGLLEEEMGYGDELLL